MTTHGEGGFTIKSWDEKTWDGKDHKDVSGAKRTHAIVSQPLHGVIEGEAESQSEMVYCENGFVSFVGLTYVEGQIEGRSGTFTLQVIGTFEDGKAIAKWVVVPGSATGELAGLRGEGGYVATHEMPVPYTLDYDFA
jgi:hypothetical protein